jgi:LysM repeat protein
MKLMKQGGQILFLLLFLLLVSCFSGLSVFAQRESAIFARTSPIQPSNNDIPPAVESRCKQMHRVKRNETLNSISKEYNVSIEDLIAANPELESNGLKRGNYICIPEEVFKVTDKKEEEEVILPSIPNQPPKTAATVGNKEKAVVVSPIHRNQEKGSTVKAAIILPFSEAESRTRMVEYYEGFLIAVDSLKRTGVSVDLHVYDSGGGMLLFYPFSNKKR